MHTLIWSANRTEVEELQEVGEREGLTNHTFQYIVHNSTKPSILMCSCACR